MQQGKGSPCSATEPRELDDRQPPQSAHAEWLPGVQLSHSVPPVQYIYRGLWGLVVVRLSWLSSRAVVAQARGVLGSTPSGCRPITSKFIYRNQIGPIKQTQTVELQGELMHTM